MSTLKQFLKEMMGYRLIPEDHIVVIERDGQAVRLAGPGYVRKNPLSECYGLLVRIGFGIKQLTLENVRSKDGESFSVQVKMLYSFNPRQCDEKRAIALISAGSDVIGQIVKDNGNKAIRYAVGSFKTGELRSGETLEKLEGEIASRLKRVLLRFGIELLEDGVAIEKITLPAHIERFYEQAAEQKVAAELQKVMAKALKDVAEVWGAMPPKGAERMMTADIFDKLAAGNSSIQLFSSPSDLVKFPFNSSENEITALTNGHRNGKPSLSKS